MRHATMCGPLREITPCIWPHAHNTLESEPNDVLFDSLTHTHTGNQYILQIIIRDINTHIQMETQTHSMNVKCHGNNL